MRQKDMVHRAGGGADIGQAGDVDTQKMRQPSHAPRLIHGGDAGHPVAKAAGDAIGINGKAVAGVAVGSAAPVGQGRGQIPVVEDLTRRKAARQQPVNQTVI
jgi:hypothetical protein